MLPSGVENPQILPFFWTYAFIGIAKWQNTQKVEQ